jgi:hypothetical protein
MSFGFVNLNIGQALADVCVPLLLSTYIMFHGLYMITLAYCIIINLKT